MTLMKKLRLSKGLRQLDVANGLHIDQSLYAKFENVKRYPKYEYLEQIADILGFKGNPKLLVVKIDE